MAENETTRERRDSRELEELTRIRIAVESIRGVLVFFVILGVASAIMVFTTLLSGS